MTELEQQLLSALEQLSTEQQAQYSALEKRLSAALTADQKQLSMALQQREARENRLSEQVESLIAELRQSAEREKNLAKQVEVLSRLVPGLSNQVDDLSDNLKTLELRLNKG